MASITMHCIKCAHCWVFQKEKVVLGLSLDLGLQPGLVCVQVQMLVSNFEYIYLEVGIITAITSDIQLLTFTVLQAFTFALFSLSHFDISKPKIALCKWLKVNCWHFRGEAYLKASEVGFWGSSMSLSPIPKSATQRYWKIILIFNPKTYMTLVLAYLGKFNLLP